MSHNSITVYGDVQGVGFRYFVKRYADIYGIKGWVRNRNDGAVEIDARGGDDDMKKFIDVIKKGNRYSTVSSTDIKKLPDTSDHGVFEIKY